MERLSHLPKDTHMKTVVRQGLEPAYLELQAHARTQ